MTKRPIEFRTWDKKLEKYINPAHIYLVGDGSLRSWGDNLLDKSRFIVEFFTGLLDRNGTKIFENDIVTVESLNNKDAVDFTGKIYWCGDRWHIEDKMGCDYDNGDYYRGDEINWVRIEVIGNVHQNPELLK